MSLEAGGGIPGLPSPAATAIKISKIGFFIYFKKCILVLAKSHTNQSGLFNDEQSNKVVSRFGHPVDCFGGFLDNVGSNSLVQCLRSYFSWVQNMSLCCETDRWG